MRNSLEYAKSLNTHGIDVELHVFPHGQHGMAMCVDRPGTPETLAHTGQWKDLLLNWLAYIGF